MRRILELIAQMPGNVDGLTRSIDTEFRSYEVIVKDEVVGGMNLVEEIHQELGKTHTENIMGNIQSNDLIGQMRKSPTPLFRNLADIAGAC